MLMLDIREVLRRDPKGFSKPNTVKGVTSLFDTLTPLSHSGFVSGYHKAEFFGLLLTVGVIYKQELLFFSRILFCTSSFLHSFGALNLK